MSSPKDSQNAVHVVVQRYRSCKVLVDESRWVSVGSNNSNNADRDGGTPQANVPQQQQQQQQQQNHCGLLVYVSFSAGATSAHVQSTAETILNLPVLTVGGWGDGVAPQSLHQRVREVSELSTDGNDANNSSATLQASIALIPQANLISKVKAKGKSLQYHGQIAKDQGDQLFAELVEEIRMRILDAVGSESTNKNAVVSEWYNAFRSSRMNQRNNNNNNNANSSAATIDPSVPPTEMFRNNILYSAWEADTGLPTHQMDGTPIAKSARKKLVKLQQAHAKKHQKWLAAAAEASSTTAPPNQPPTGRQAAETTTPPTDAQWDNALREVARVAVVPGTFGKRQGLEIQSDMGPFCHVFQIAQ